MGNQKKIQDIENRITLFFDNALGEPEKKELLNEVDTDPRAKTSFIKEQNLRNFIKDNVVRPAVSTDFIQSIMDRVKIN